MSPISFNIDSSMKTLSETSSNSPVFLTSRNLRPVSDGFRQYFNASDITFNELRLSLFISNLLSFR